LTPEEARKIKYRRVRGVFPMLVGAEYETITMKIFSYVDVRKKSLRIMSQLNTKGYMLGISPESVLKEI
jgi:hypothetical protein